MLLRENYTAEHILRLREETGAVFLSKRRDEWLHKPGLQRS